MAPIELKTALNGLGGRNSLEFGTVRPRVKSRAPTKPTAEGMDQTDPHPRPAGKRLARQCG